MGTETWIISLPLSDSILYLKIIHPPNFREEPKFTPIHVHKVPCYDEHRSSFIRCHIHYECDTRMSTWLSLLTERDTYQEDSTFN